MTVRFVVGGYTADLPCYQWGYTDATRRYEREPAATDEGAMQRTLVGNGLVTARKKTVRFEGIDTNLDRVRQVTTIAHRTSDRVQFFPDIADLGTYWWVGWQTSLQTERIIENRRAVELTLVEQAA